MRFYDRFGGMLPIYPQIHCSESIQKGPLLGASVFVLGRPAFSGPSA